MNSKALIHDSFDVPVEASIQDFIIMKVDPDYAKLDYEALMSAKEFIRKQLGSEWPSDNFTLKENTDSLFDDLTSFNNKTSFTYHILNRQKSQIIGCFYVSSPIAKPYDASVFIWVKKEYLSSPVFPKIKTAIKSWISQKWPLKRVDYSLNKQSITKAMKQ
ncbi:hypothetical protein JQC92_20875 [Shewanella sp. 202IG2-18]|uniref:hypothetical protein n=1 Tax=Parashewanella hymeniacidonis TaxID=2807618 RepID=UPI00195F64AD|nr:hypothetical protein [Parashewanella hymeniacidonis]MBM7074445.1 hypothetical protein [Parashewanella hymeniacidonis]